METDVEQGGPWSIERMILSGLSRPLFVFDFLCYIRAMVVITVPADREEASIFTRRGGLGESRGFVP